MEEKWNDLLGAVVGLVRTADREPADEETKRLVETALCRLLDGSAWTDALMLGRGLSWVYPQHI